MSGAEDFKDIVTVTLVTASYNTLGSNLYFKLFEILHTDASVIKITVGLSH